MVLPTIPDNEPMGKANKNVVSREYLLKMQNPDRFSTGRIKGECETN
jgi:hypothetical protein